MCKNCSDLPWKELIALYKKNKRFRKGETIFSEGQKIEGIYFLYSGNVKVYRRWDKRKDLIIRFASAGDILGHRGWETKNIYPVSASALDNVVICFVPSVFFLSVIKSNNVLSYELMRFFAAELEIAEDRMRILTHLESRGRTAVALLALKEQFGTDKNNYIDIVLNRQDIASFAGTTYETLFRILQELQSKNIIRASGKKIRILKESSLKKIAGFN